MKPMNPILPPYVRVLRVTASRISGWAMHDEGKIFTFTLDSGDSVEVNINFVLQNRPEIGHYYVIDEASRPRTVKPANFEANYARAPDLQPIAWPELEKLASMQPQAVIVTKNVPPSVPVKRELGIGTMMQMVKMAGRA